jgi:hypothetical protein
MINTLVFVYNANSGFANSVFDVAHKLVSPNTYNCNLCVLTHSIFAERKEWKAFKETTNVNMQFLHKNEFADLYGKENTTQFPAVFAKQENKLEELISAAKINALQNTSEFIKVIKERLAIQ